MPTSNSKISKTIKLFTLQTTTGKSQVFTEQATSLFNLILDGSFPHMIIE